MPHNEFKNYVGYSFNQERAVKEFLTFHLKELGLQKKEIEARKLCQDLVKYRLNQKKLVRLKKETSNKVVSLQDKIRKLQK